MLIPIASGGGATEATQAEMEAASSSTAMVTPRRVVAHPGTAKGWIYFNGAGTVAINANYNVTSITDNGVGDYTINWTTAFSSANYCVATHAGRDSVYGVGLMTGQQSASGMATGSYRVRVVGGNPPVSGYSDLSDLYLVAFGDQ